MASAAQLFRAANFDLALNTIRIGLISVPGVGIPYHLRRQATSCSRWIWIPKALEAQNISQQDVVNALTTQNLVFPSGTAKLAPTSTPSTSTPAQPDRSAKRFAIKTVDGAVILIRDVASA